MTIANFLQNSGKTLLGIYNNQLQAIIARKKVLIFT